MADKIRVTVWNEFRHEKTNEKAMALYPDGIHGYIKSFLSDCEDMEVRLAALDDEECGLTDDVLNNTDVLLWWGHMAHKEVPDEIAEKVRARVYAGMGLFPLHSGHKSKPFLKTVGTTGQLSWGRGQKAVVWNLAPTHPIAAGVPLNFEIFEELYSEPFYIPTPDEVVFGTWFEDGYIFRGGVTFRHGLGKIFYFHPGHETFPSFKNEHVQRIIKNAIRWAKPAELTFEYPKGCPHLLCDVFGNEVKKYENKD